MRKWFLEEKKRLAGENKKLARQTFDAIIKTAAEKECNNLLQQIKNAVWMAQSRTKPNLAAAMYPAANLLKEHDMLVLYKILADLLEHRVKQTRG